MRWDGNRESDNVEDRRDEGGGGLPGFRLGGGGIGLGTIAIGLVAWLVFGANPLQVISALSGGGHQQVQTQPQQPKVHSAEEEREAKLVRVVLADTEDVWGQIFQQRGASYQQPKLVLFSNSTPTACGQGQSAMGPFYCPADRKVYIDLAFYRTLNQQLGAPGEFAEAYVIAHEVGHHVQNLLGISDKVDALRRKSSERKANALSVRLELQADCFAGVWGNHADKARHILEGGDLESALNAASKIGDDTLQRSAGQAVVPDSFTHGSSEQRVRWFRRGFDGGDIAQCDTFSANPL
ncbi:KPN_02809 family neutral zinc metallopeptidase [Aquitalea aquatica]|uniref:Neutral zinc metallopeptidase n=1 Tax=Aquitalea aquatica TaxID=3044273 RepID=A0A838Y6C6_9NEIS|nr:neutral zinc metallopeptidase [Aquitalea magnusonii]MBA4709388.1 neutral zinc metallopeptidase [Aquitalea magnusonii]